MSWTTLKPDDILARLADGERAALARATGDLDDAILADVLGQTAALVRGYIGAHRGNALASGALAIPPSLKSAALDLAVVAYSIRAAGTLLDPKGARAAARDAAQRLLQDVAAGKFAVEAPGGADDEPSGGIELASGAGARPASQSLNGLI